MRSWGLFLLLCLLALPTPLWAASGPWQRDKEIAVRLIARDKGTGGQKEALLGLEVQLAEGWHTYWRTPGEAGQKPDLTWQGSDNLGETTFLYPSPIRYDALGMETVGYKGHVIFPIRANVADPAKPLVLNGTLDILICGDICLPKHFSLALTLTPDASGEDSEAALLKDALARVPGPANAELSIKKVTRGGSTLIVEAHKNGGFKKPDLFIENDRDALFTKPDLALSTGGRTATFTATLDSTLPDGESLEGLPLTLTLTDGEQALERRYDPKNPIQDPPASEDEAGLTPLLLALFPALLGGLILNLMPCVLPVLSIKVMSVLRHGGRAKKAVRRSFLASAGGILFSFWILAGLTVGLRGAGASIGWGFQFQHPVFLVFMISVLTFFALNMWGLFTIQPPRFALKALDKKKWEPGLAGDFVSGAFATLLATPCSAPFLGTALAFALSGSAREILAVFTAMGIGLALPYFALALWPRAVSALPKPGKWMEILSRILALGLAATALWLLYVLRHQMSRTSTLFIAAMMGFIGLQMLLRHKKIFRALTVPVIVAALAGAFGLAYVAAAPSSHAPEMGAWEKFDEGALARHVAEGKTVFVDVTADWCLTCKANKRFALTNDEVKTRLTQTPGTVALQADWTSPNPDATAFLQKHNRYGVPFNIVYGPAAPDGITLPELLTPGMVLKALNEASCGQSVGC